MVATTSNRQSDLPHLHLQLYQSTLHCIALHEQGAKSKPTNGKAPLQSEAKASIPRAT
jgi:hypothetical protein